MSKLAPRLSRRAAATYGLVALLAFGLGALVFRDGPEPAPPEAPAREPGPSEHETAHEHTAASPQIWTCAMHPQIQQGEPGQCPICGMDLVPVQAHSDPDDARADRVTLSARAKALARLQTTEILRVADPRQTLRLLGRVEADETRTRTVTAWVGGRIDRLHVKVTGERLRAGQKVATLYSPEVLSAHQDLIAARHQVERMQGATAGGRAAAEAALNAARTRLRLLGVPEARVASMASEDKPTRQVVIHTPFAGTVTERVASEGAYVSTGDPLYRVADLSRLWVQLDAYERDLPALQVGQAVDITVEALPGETFEGRVAFIEPMVDAQRRTARVRVEVANKAGRLRPGLFAQAVVQAQAGDGAERPLVIPATAPLLTGRRALVYVEVPDADRPTYEARNVRRGARAGEVYPVLAGLHEGERVVSRGAFVLDADLQIRGGDSMMATPDADEDRGPWDQVIELSAAERRPLRPVVSAYLELQRALADDDLAKTKSAAAALAKAVASAEIGRPSTAKDAWPPLARDLGQHAEQMAKADSLEAVRGHLEPLSSQMTGLLQRFGNPLEQPLSLAFCPMVEGGGAAWVQQGTAIENPYFGHAMRSCGEVRETTPPDGYLPLPQSASATPAAAPAGHQH